jgi:hypothetical protein
MSNALLARLCIVYGQPDSHDPTAYLAEVAKMLARYTAADLQRAGDHIIRTHKFRSFPTPAQIVVACEDARPQQMTPEMKGDPSWSKEAIAHADRLVNCELGRRAAHEGWILGLHDYCRKHGALPPSAKVGVIISDARFVDGVADGSIDAGACAPALRRLAKTFQRKRGEIVARAGIDTSKRFTGEAAE